MAIYKGAYWYVFVVSEIINGVDFVQFFFFVSHTNQCCFLICLHLLFRANCPANFATLTHIKYLKLRKLIIRNLGNEYFVNIQTAISSIKYVFIWFPSKFSKTKINRNKIGKDESFVFDCCSRELFTPFWALCAVSYTNQSGVIGVGALKRLRLIDNFNINIYYSFSLITQEKTSLLFILRKWDVDSTLSFYLFFA